jgi:hypothetical protein
MRGRLLSEAKFADASDSSNLSQRTKMRRQFCRFCLDEIGFYVLDNPVAHSRRQKTDNRSVNRRRRGERPAFLSVARDNFHNLIGKFFMNAAVGFSFKLRSLCNRICMTPACTVAHRKAPGQIAHLVHQSAVSIRNIERLHQLQARATRGRLVHSVCFQTAAISDDD